MTQGNRKTGLVVLFLALLAGASAHSLEPLAPPGAPAHAFPAPDRPVAEIISPIWATEQKRDAVDESGQLVRLLGLEPGMTVADLGAGSGYHTVRLARALGPEGRVLAQDVTPRYLEGLQERVRKEGLGNVTLGLGEPHDPRLPAGSADVALLAHVYHEIAQPFAFLHNLAPALKPGGRLAIVELDRPTREHGTPRDLLRCELAASGYRQVSVSKLSGKIGYLAVFAPPAADERPRPNAIKPCRAKRR
jgi:SAM-dependent methyltransferase